MEYIDNNDEGVGAMPQPTTYTTTPTKPFQQNKQTLPLHSWFDDDIYLHMYRLLFLSKTPYPPNGSGSLRTDEQNAASKALVLSQTLISSSYNTTKKTNSNDKSNL
jgi:hypothetical protein